MRFISKEYTKPLFDCRPATPMPKDYPGPVVHHEFEVTGKTGGADGWIVWRKCKACGEELGEYPVRTENLPCELSR